MTTESAVFFTVQSHQPTLQHPALKQAVGPGGFDYSSVGARDINSSKVFCCIPTSPIVRKIDLLGEAGSVLPVSCLPPAEQEVN